MENSAAKPKIFRKRFIPFETVDISGDELLYRDNNLLVTRWKTIKLRPDIAGGISYTFLSDGYKISRFYDSNGKFIYWYCDIIEVEYHRADDMYILKDLLVDIKLMPDGAARVLDADELAEALEKKLITPEQACMGLRRMDTVLRMMYDGSFPPEVCRDENYWIK